MYGPFTRRKPPHIRQVLMSTLDTANRGDLIIISRFYMDDDGRLICIINITRVFQSFVSCAGSISIMGMMAYHDRAPTVDPRQHFHHQWFFVLLLCRAARLSYNQRECSRPSRGRRFVAVSIFCCCFLIRENWLADSCSATLPFLFENVVNVFHLESKLSNDVVSLLFCCTWNLKVLEDNNEQSFSLTSLLVMAYDWLLAELIKTTIVN